MKTTPDEAMKAAPALCPLCEGHGHVPRWLLYLLWVWIGLDFSHIVMSWFDRILRLWW